MSSKVVRVGAYGRVSTLNQVREHDSSVDTQMQRIHLTAKYETERGQNWKIVAEYREEGRSGKDTDRPELQRLLADVRAGKLDLVCVTKLDRITRSLVDFYDLWAAFQEHGVEFMALDDRFETGSATGRAMLKIMLVFAELERERTSERTREKALMRRDAGLWFGGQVPFGYQVHPSNKTALEVDEDAAGVVRREIFEKFLELGSARAVVRHLSQRGIRRAVRETRRGTKTGGTAFTTQGVLNLLANPTYIGKRHLDDGREIECAWPPVIDEALFNRVQAKLSSNSLDKPTGKSKKAHTYLLEGLLRCGSCGSMMVCSSGNGRGGTYFYYRCSRKNHTASTECQLRDVSVRVVEGFVLDQLRAYAVDEQAIREAVSAANEGRDEALARLSHETANARAAHSKAKQNLNALLDVVENGGGQITSLLTRLKEAEDREQALKHEVIDLEAKRAALQDEMLTAEVVAEGYRNLHRLLTEALTAGVEADVKELLRAVIDVVEWRENPENPKQGTALIQLFELPSGFGLDDGQKNEQPCKPLNGGSQGCPNWLRGEDSNLGPGD